MKSRENPMMFSDIVPVVISVIAGGIAGIVFFGGLWVTVKRAVTMRQPALLMIASLIVRAAIVMAIFYVVSTGEFVRLAACMAGFLLVRAFIVRYFEVESKPT